MPCFLLNHSVVRTDQPPGLVVLEFVRHVACLSGTKEACHEGECGACTVLVGTPRGDGSVAYRACASCLLPLGEVEGSHVVTVEGLDGGPPTLVQRLIIEHSASQCGFCTPGIVLSLTGFCLASPTLAYDDALDALDGNLCRCTGYVGIRAAARALCERLAGLDRDPARRVAALVAAGVLPAGFLAVPGQLAQLPAAPAPAPAGTSGVLVAGGTDLFVQRPEELLEGDLCFLSRRRDLDHVRVDGGLLRVGAAVTLEALRRSDAVARHLPALVRDLTLHSSTILRNQATLTGNIVNASPIGDCTIILLALDARLVIEAGDGALRETPLARFFLGYKRVDLACGELIREVVIPFLPAGARYHFEKVSNRTTLDIAAVNSAMRATTAPDGTLSDLRISAGGVGPVPFLVGGLEAFHGRRVDAALGDAVARVAMAEARPIDDVRGSAVYKKLLLGQLVRAHLATLAAPEVSR